MKSVTEVRLQAIFERHCELDVTRYGEVDDEKRSFPGNVSWGLLYDHYVCGVAEVSLLRPPGATESAENTTLSASTNHTGP